MEDKYVVMLEGSEGLDGLCYWQGRTPFVGSLVHAKDLQQELAKDVKLALLPSVEFVIYKLEKI